MQDSRWSAAQIELRQGARPGTARFANGHVLPANEVIATASAASGPLGSFSVDWTERQPTAKQNRDAASAKPLRSAKAPPSSWYERRPPPAATR